MSIPTRGPGLEAVGRCGKKDAMSIARESVAVQVAGVQAFSIRYRARPSDNTAATGDSTMPEGRQRGRWSVISLTGNLIHGHGNDDQ